MFRLNYIIVPPTRSGAAAPLRAALDCVQKRGRCRALSIEGICSNLPITNLFVY